MKTGMVQIVVKAPNQMIDDQIIECDRSWTISQLKEHLSIKYPTHPIVENQKLIYSGKLLSDELLLTNVLKTYGGHEYNTIHLVCSISENNMMNHNKTISDPVQATVQINNTSIFNSGEQPTFWALPQPAIGVMPRNYDELRIRLNGVLIHGTYFQSQQEELAHQTFFIQQAYTEYMMNYIHMANDGRLHMNVRGNEHPEMNEEFMHEIPQNQVAPDAENEDEAGAQRDWLEWMYIATRLVVLFSVVYFYSSPLRFIVVMTMAFLLFNMDVERWRRRHEDAGVADAAGQRQQQHRHQFQQETAGGGIGATANNNQQNNGINSYEPANNVPPQQQRREPHPLHVVLIFIATYFLSLIPEQRPE